MKHASFESYRHSAPDSSSPPPAPTPAPRYAYGTCSFEPPANDHVDGLLIAVRAPEGGPPANVSVTREPMRPGDALRTHADRKLMQLGREAPELELLDSRAFDAGGRAAILVRFSWKRGAERLEQTMVLIDPGNDEERWVTIFNATSPAAHAEMPRRLLLEMVQSVRFSAGAPSVPPAAPATSRRSTPPSAEPPPALVPMPGYPRR